MGVPSFFRWLINKYPKVLVNAIELHHKGDHESPDACLPNPNGVEYDNLYLDMNGIIHPCFHPESDDDRLLPPSTFEEVFRNVFEYVDRLVNIVRPRNLLYLAIDGVAPRAKMNQQRTRRFKSAKDKELADDEEEKLRRQFELEGKQVLPKQESEVWDSNIITPGTDFMYRLSKALRSYISFRLTNDSGWRDIKVILSDANVPGEGEQKIMSFIRQQRNLPSYNTNTRHCLYGLDADLIMLALATHEVHFSIIREDVLNQEQQHNGKPIGENISSSGRSDGKEASMIKKSYQFVLIWILREYLELDLQVTDPPDLERIVDDFIFMCFFAGNDFLPHMPTLEIHEGAIDLLMSVYKKEFKNFGGYLVDMFRVDDRKLVYIKLSRVEKFILLVADHEEKILKKRSELRDRKLKRFCQYEDSPEVELDAGSSNMDSRKTCAFDNGENSASVSVGTSYHSHTLLLENTKELKQNVKDNIRKKSDLFKNGDLGTDKIRFGATGYKERYYKYKFSAEGPGDLESKRKELVKSYTEGLLWVLQYYFSGPPSWTWFYPFHYGPFASDLKGLAQVKPKFQKGSPFKPIDTLMAILPPRSAHALPEVYRKLMTEESSNIIDFYPSDFEIDMDGKRFTWQGICKLPFIEEERLLSETKNLNKELVGDERDRNTEKTDQLYVRKTNNFTSEIESLYGKENCYSKIENCVSYGIGGSICLPDDSTCEGGDHKLQEDTVLCVKYKLPDSGPHMPRLLHGVDHPVKTITPGDIKETKLWHEYQGSTPASTTISRSQHATERFGKPENMRNSENKNRFTYSSPESVHKFGGSGWSGSGRRKAITSPDFQDPFYAPRAIHSERTRPSSSFSAKGAPYYKTTALQGTSVCKQKWTAVASSSGNPMQALKDLNISEQTQSRGWWPNARVELSNNVFRSSARLHSSQFNTTQGRGREQQHTLTHYSPFTARTSYHGGRGHFVPRSSVKEGNGKW